MTATADRRWWEGRKLWGSLVNNSRNMALKLDQLLEPALMNDRQFFRAMIPNFAFAPKNHLRQQPIDREFTETASFSVQQLHLNEHVPQQIALVIFGKVVELQWRGILLPEHLVILNPELQSLMEICGACERLKIPRFHSRTARLSKNLFRFTA